MCELPFGCVDSTAGCRTVDHPSLVPFPATCHLSFIPTVRHSSRSRTSNRRQEHRIGAVNVRPELDRRSITKSRNVIPVDADKITSVDRDRTRLFTHGGNNFDGLSRMRGTRRIDDHTAWTYQTQRFGQQFPLQDNEFRDLRRLASPPRLGTSTKRTQASTRSVNEDPVVAGLKSAHATVGDVNSDR